MIRSREVNIRVNNLKIDLTSFLDKSNRRFEWDERLFNQAYMFYHTVQNRLQIELDKDE